MRARSRLRNECWILSSAHESAGSPVIHTIDLGKNGQSVYFLPHRFNPATRVPQLLNGHSPIPEKPI